MRPCPQCGTPCPDAVWTCPACGFDLGGNLKQTLVATPGTSPLGPARQTSPLEAAPVEAAPLEAARQTLPLEAARQTLPLDAARKTSPLETTRQTSPLEGASTLLAPPPAPAAPAAEPPAPPAAQKLRGTMLGLGLSVPVPPPGHSGAPQSIPTQTLIGGSPVPAQGAPSVPPTTSAGLKGTMIGLAPVIPSPPPPPPEGPRSGGVTVSLNKQHSGPKTILGVARPGIAPLNPGMAKAAPVTSLPAPQDTAAPEPTWNAPAADMEPELPRKRRVPWIAVTAILGAAVLASAGVMTVLLYRARGNVETRLVADQSGRDRLELTCPGCVEGAKVTLGSATGTFKAGKATLTLARPLPVGEHKMELSIERAPGRADQVEVTVPVDFRVRPDTAKLAEMPPRVEARVTARAGSVVVVDGRPLPLGADGSASLAIDVSKDLTGAEPSVKTLERRITYSVTPPGGTPHPGEMLVRLGIAPLVVQAPGPSIMIDGPGFVLSGRTAKNAIVTVEGRPISVDPTGSFAQMMSVSSNGETTVVVRASVPDLAPRLFTLKVKRVPSLLAEAALARARSTTSYATVATNPDGQRGQSVALDGSVVDARSDSFTTLLVMDVKSGCNAPPCLARVTSGTKIALAAGDPVSVFGVLEGSVEGPRTGTRIPAVAADFVLKGRP